MKKRSIERRFCEAALSLCLAISLTHGLLAEASRNTDAQRRSGAGDDGTTSMRPRGTSDIQRPRMEPPAPPLFCRGSWSLRFPFPAGFSEGSIKIVPAGDVNGDGFGDALIGEAIFTRTIFRQGRVTLFRGSPAGLLKEPLWAVEGTQEYGRLGRSMASAGRINADDLDDIIIGMAGFGGDQFEEGKALIFAGSTTGLSTQPIWTTEGNHVYRSFGDPVARAGDVNGDGHDDILVGGEGEQQLYPTRVFPGSESGLSPVAAWRTFAARQVSPAGDVNGDGYDDILVGQSSFEHNEPEEGVVALYTGSESGLGSVPAWYVEGNDWNLGLGVYAGAGDINGDGYDDVLLGSRLGTHVVYGTPEGPTTRMGLLVPSRSARPAGDVNDDGFADVLLTGPDQTSWLHLGSPWGLAQEPIWSVNVHAYPIWGYATAGGDLNGDALDDLVATKGMDAFTFLSIGCNPCDSWRNHGAYVSCVTGSLHRLQTAGAIDEEEAKARKLEATHSLVGMRGHRPAGCARPSTCGNGIVEGAEICDGPALRQETCVSQGFDSGTLACNQFCTGFELSGCTTRCGDGRRNGREVCDGSDFGALGCESQGFDRGYLQCSATCDEVITDGCAMALCGDNRIQGHEICDGSDYPTGGGCLLLGLGTAPAGPRCTSSCQLDVTNCSWLNSSGGRSCGDGHALTASHGTYRESCDGSLLKNMTCGLLQFEGGSLACRSDCRSFDLSGCTGGCGNGIIEEGELCDAGNVGGMTCGDLGRGYTGGTLTCNALCNGYESSGCCGDGVRSDNETCDGSDLGTASCLTQGFPGGVLACSATCAGFDTSGCMWCGNGIREGGEACDGQDIGSVQCDDLGFAGGTPGCSSACDRFDLSSCVGGCGNGIIEDDEACDGASLGGETCNSLGYEWGFLRCMPSCVAFDESGCYR